MESEHHLLANETDPRGIIPVWNSSILGVGIEIPPVRELNCSSGQLSDCFFTSNWDPPSLDHNNINDPFESALSSIVSSPVASGAAAGDGFIIRELIGRLGSICNSGEVSPKSHNASCYNTPLNSPPKLNLAEPKPRPSLLPITHLPSLHAHPAFSPLNADPEFVERAATFSCFGARNLTGSGPALFAPEFVYGSSLPKLEPRELSSQVNGELKSGGPENAGEIGDSREGSSVSELNPPTGRQSGGTTQNDANSRKRKANAKSKRPAPAKEDNVVRENVDDELPNTKRTKKMDEDANKNETNDDSKPEENGQEKQNKIKETAKLPEPPKDYIHVRARRGQATDSHSLAERVRREKISERMKFLQDLVPGCNKVTGKAVVLDEIINYVQSLQRQVEFLSMKLATVNPQLELNTDAILSKDFFHSRGSFQPAMYPSETTAAQAQAFPYGYNQSQIIQPASINGAYCGSDNLFGMMTHLNQSVQRNPSSQLDSIDGCCKTFGADDLHSIVQMGLSHNLTERSEGTNKPTTTAMKVEL